MVDIETLGLDVGSVIISIGAVKFDEDTIGETFEESISLQSCQEAGLEIDADTLDWWLDQDKEAQQQLQGGNDLTRVLSQFNTWLHGVDELWANSPSFDCEMLEHAMDQVGISPHWEYYEERDYRTVMNLPCAVESEFEGVEHDALDDALKQAHDIQQTLRELE